MRERPELEWNRNVNPEISGRNGGRNRIQIVELAVACKDFVAGKRLLVVKRDTAVSLRVRVSGVSERDYV